MTGAGVEPEMARHSQRWLNIVLMIFAAVQAFGHATDWVVLVDEDPTIPGPSLGGLVISAVIVLRPLIALAGLVFAARGQTALAIIAIASVSLLSWVSYLPSVVIHWGSGELWNVEAAVMLVILPALALMAVVMAARGRRLVLAAILATLPTIVNILAVVAFAIGVAIYGF